MPLITGGSRRLLSGSQRNHGRSTGGPSQQINDDPVELPDYEPLSFPLTPTALRALSTLSTDKVTRKYEEQLKRSIELLGDSVRDLNDRYVARKDMLKRLQEKRGPDGEKNDRERAEEKGVRALKDVVPQLSADSDLAVRSVIDLRIELEDGSDALRETARKVEAESLRAAQREQNRDEGEDVQMADADIPNFTSPISLLEKAREAAAAEYASKTLYEKYGVNNDYIGFKSMWHDAVHGNDAKPLPDASKWFSKNGGDEEEDEDDDLIVAEEHLDIHCPLSMQVMQDPYTSKRCKHTFEKDPIFQFLRANHGHLRARCPQTGCSKELSISDLEPDPVMLRKIKRRLAEQRAIMEEDEDEDEEDDVDEDGDSQMNAASTHSVKMEREGRGKGRRLIEDIEDGEEEE
ncbi:zinc-finger of the MIZ type in Nse subunit-domain-containing protein [Hypoxylon sp. NC1633]|nr:zinc-finger of the MIZ type in Nse subunit-domain-containing protein [Hypoxylon sp. NC1633]